MTNQLQRAQKIMERINELAAISEEANGITRLFGTAAFLQGSSKVLAWMQTAGMDARIDNIGNVRGRLLSDNPAAKTLVIASHIDTVRNAGKFDGPMGVLMGLAVIEDIIQSGTALPFHIELIAFSDEEGVRFHTTYLGSKVVAGSFETSLLNKKDEHGISLYEVIEQMDGDTDQLKADAIAATDWLGYFEIHIEQGPVLYEKNIPVGLVTAIAGQRRAEIIFSGVAGHAGTVPMHMRNDALCCAAEFILEAEKLAISNNVVTTVGKLQVTNAASNTIAGEVICSLDLRSANETAGATAYEQLRNKCLAICTKRNIIPEWKLVQHTAPVLCDGKLKSLLAQSVEEAGYPLVEMLSGAGHDGVAIAAVAPVAMLFVRCFKGISHNPLEAVELKDMAAAIKVSDNFIRRLINTIKERVK
ncbi:MAG: M20 family metallo-hydrolase [Chitinophagaceae bacterium]